MVSNLVIALLAMICLLLGLIAALIFITLLTPPALRLPVLGALTLGLLIASALTFWRLMSKMASQPAPFSLTMTEVRKDLDALLRKD